MPLPNLDIESMELFVNLCDTMQLSQAAERSHMSVSSASRVLARLRVRFGDDLFRKSLSGMLPTVKARSLEGPVRELLRQYEKICRGEQETFSPSKLDLSFRIGAVDQGVYSFLSFAGQKLLELAPQATLDFRPLTLNFAEELRTGILDIALYPCTFKGKFIHFSPICRDTMIYAVSDEDPLAKAKRVTESMVLKRRLVKLSVTPLYGIEYSKYFRQQSFIPSRSPFTAIWTPYFLTLPAFLKRSSLVAVMPFQLAYRLRQDGHKIKILGRPQDSPIFEPALIWHDNVHEDTSHQWLRGLILSSLPQLPDPDDVPVIGSKL